MSNPFDELTKSIAQSTTRRTALKKLGIGLAGMALACFGLANTAKAAPCSCATDADCAKGEWCSIGYGCCPGGYGSCCCKNHRTQLPKCSLYYSICASSCAAGIPK